jgi:hypothetical protein
MCSGLQEALGKDKFFYVSDVIRTASFFGEPKIMAFHRGPERSSIAFVTSILITSAWPSVTSILKDVVWQWMDQVDFVGTIVGGIPRRKIDR